MGELTPEPDIVATLVARVEKGKVWLTENGGPGVDVVNELGEQIVAGAFHLWFKARIPPGAPMPAVPDDVQQAYAEYHVQRLRWERMLDALERADGR